MPENPFAGGSKADRNCRAGFPAAKIRGQITTLLRSGKLYIPAEGSQFPRLPILVVGLQSAPDVRQLLVPRVPSATDQL